VVTTYAAVQSQRFSFSVASIRLLSQDEKAALVAASNAQIVIQISDIQPTIGVGVANGEIDRPQFFFGLQPIDPVCWSCVGNQRLKSGDGAAEFHLDADGADRLEIGDNADQAAEIGKAADFGNVIDALEIGADRLIDIAKFREGDAIDIQQTHAGRID
jgi:hypothetical protein